VGSERWDLRFQAADEVDELSCREK
jgi:hypothetical protein